MSVPEDEMTECITNAMAMNLGKLQEMVRNWEAWRAAALGLQRVGHDWRLNHNNDYLMLYP